MFALHPQSGNAKANLRIVTTIAPLYSLTKGVMGDVGSPDLLLKQGESPHHYNLRPNDAERIAKADIIITTNRAYAYYLDPVLKIMPKRKAIFIEALAIPGLNTLPSSAEPQEKAALGESFIDMHFWLSPVNAIAYTSYIAEVLSGADPAHASAYNRNAAAQIERIRKLDNSIKGRLGKKPLQAHYASYHPSLAYFEKHYHIQGGKAITRTPESGASVAEAENLYQQIENGNLRCLFREPEFSSKLLQQAADHYGDTLKIITLDPLGSTYALDDTFYESLLNDVAQAIAECSSRSTAQP
jgi:zinc transport system substrate-binding protein